MAHEWVGESCSDSVVEDLRTKGYFVLKVPTLPDDWEDCFRTAFLEQTGSQKKEAGAYRIEKGQAIGYRKDESREFFETRLVGEGWKSCEPKYLLGQDELNYEKTICTMSNILGDVGEWVIGGISRAQGLDPSFLVALTDVARAERGLKRGEGEHSSSLLRVCYYPAGLHTAQTNPGSSNVAFGSHTDTSFVTVSPCSSVSGVEIQDLTTKEWQRPELRFGDGKHVVVFAGEMLEAVTKHVYRAAVHRVLAPLLGHRISCPFLIRCDGACKFLPSDEKFTHPGGTDAIARLPDLEDMKMGLVQKILDLKRGRCVRNHSNSGEDWVLRAYEEHEQVVG